MPNTATGVTSTDRLRIVYFGTPAFAVPALDALVAHPAFDVCLVVTQPDRPAGRGRRLTASPVKVAAGSHGLPVYQPHSLRTPDDRAPISAAGVDLFVVAAYGLIFGPKTLALPRIACVNVHASLLPAYRGASPISAAIAQGDAFTGVSLMVMDVGLDTGPVIANGSIPIAPRDTTETLTQRLAVLGADLISANLLDFANGQIPPTSQPSEDATVTRPLTKSDGWLDWRKSAAELERQVRAMWPWPRAWTTISEEPLQIHLASVGISGPTVNHSAAPGTLTRIGSKAVVACGKGQLILETVQRAGGRPISSESFLLGHPYLEDSILGQEGVPTTPPAPLIVPAT